MLDLFMHLTNGQLACAKPAIAIKPLTRTVSTFILALAVAVSANAQTNTTNKPTERAKLLKVVKVIVDAEDSPSSQLEYLTVIDDSGALGDKAILDTPFSVTIVDSDEINERGAKSIGQVFVNDASIYAPTPSFSTDWWGTQIRGLPVRNFYIDDIPMLLYWGGDFPIEAAQSVTALKGLTGFMYGFGEPGGAISYKIKRPKTTPEISIDLTYLNPTLLSAHVDTSHNIGDEFAFRANLATDQGTAYNASEIDRTVASLSVDKNFGGSITWFTNLVYEKHIKEGEPLQFYFSDYDYEGSNGKLPEVNYDYDDFNVDNSYYNTETILASTGVEWELNEYWNLKYKIGVSRKVHESNKSFAYLNNRDGDYTGYSYNFAGQLDNLFNQIMLQGVASTDDIKHEIVVGIGQQKNDEKWGTDWYWENDFNGNIHEEQPFLITRTPDFSLESDPSLESSQTYGFASDTIHLNEHWQTIIGLRYTHYDLENAGYSTKEASPTMALIYKPGEQTSFYGSYVEGMEPGTRVGPTFNNAGDLLDATVSKQYEVGTKHASGKFNYTVALFRIERTNQMAVIKGDNILPDLTQDGLETYEGVEFATAYQFTDNLNLGLSVTYLDGTIENVANENAELEGNDPAYASDWQYVGNFEYLLPGIDGLKLHGNVRYFDQSYTGIENTLTVPSYTLINAGVSYEFESWDRLWKINGNIFNLTNEKYWAGGGWSSGNMGEERNISIGLNMMF